MSKQYYIRGKFRNKVTVTKVATHIHLHAKKVTKFVETLIVRGIGYRAFALRNDLISDARRGLDNHYIDYTRPVYTSQELDDSKIVNQASSFEFPNARYLAVRAGHTRDLYVPLSGEMQCITSKKDRKLVIASTSKIIATGLAKYIHLYRAPSVYTGRGVRIKHVKPIRKAGKKDKQKGKAF